MPSQAEYLTKADAARWFRRSERSISRDITNAIKAGDPDVLPHVRLQLEDGTIRAGTDITIEEIIGLRDAGKNPTWEIDHRWLTSRYGRRGDVPQETADADVLPPLPQTDENNQRGAPIAHELPTEPNLRLAVLEVVNSELEKRNQEKSDQIKRLEKELDRRAEERREETELQRQNNVLMQQVYDLLSKMHQSSGEISLFVPSPRSRALTPSLPVDEERQPSVDATVIETPAPTGTRRKGSQPLEKTPRKKRRSAEKRTPLVAKTSAPLTPAKPNTTKKPPSKLFPTLDRAVRSLFGR
jgi:hypothetical protein